MTSSKGDGSTTGTWAIPAAGAVSSAAMGFVPSASTSEEPDAQLHHEMEKWAKAIRAADINAQ